MKQSCRSNESTTASAEKLDLFNFDSPTNKTSRYILTSPRSLKACSRLGIKPVELLPSSLHEFSTRAPSSLSQGNGGAATLEAVYEEWERQRRGKLQAARRERERIIAELEGRGQSHDQRPRDRRRDANVEIVTVPARPKEKNGRLSMTDDSTVKDKDQRILDALERHYVSEKKASLLKSAVDLQWDIQKKKEQMEKDQREAKRQKELSHSQQHFQSQVRVSIQQLLVCRDERVKKIELFQNMSQLRSLQTALEDEEKLRLLSSLEAKWDRWNSSVHLQAKAKSQRIEEKRFQEEKKKKLQEQRRLELEAEEQEARETVGCYWRELESKAEENRVSRATSESMERQLKRKAAESRHKQKMEALEEELRAQNESLRSYLTERDSLVQQRYHIHKKHKEAAIRQASECRSQRAVKAKRVTEELEMELEERRRELEDHLQQSMTQAELVTQRLLEERRQRAHTDRVRREKVHSEKMGQLLAEERERRLQYAEEIGVKSERSESILKGRHILVEKSRQAAHASATQRQKVKDKYLRKSFDKMALEAELFASLERKHSQNTKPHNK